MKNQEEGNQKRRDEAEREDRQREHRRGLWRDQNGGGAERDGVNKVRDAETLPKDEAGAMRGRGEFESGE